MYKRQPLITLESDKATMDIPAPVAGTVTAVRVSVGDRVSAGHLIADLRTTEYHGARGRPRTSRGGACQERPGAR